MLKIAIALSLVGALSSQAFADDLSASAAKAAEEQAQQQQQEQASHRAIPKAYLYGGTALFVGGLTAAVYGFVYNQNTGYSGYKGTTLVLNEASATNTLIGTVGIGLAFTGGTILFLGERHARRSATVISAEPGKLALAQRFTW